MEDSAVISAGAYSSFTLYEITGLANEQQIYRTGTVHGVSAGPTIDCAALLLSEHVPIEVSRMFTFLEMNPQPWDWWTSVGFLHLEPFS